MEVWCIYFDLISLFLLCNLIGNDIMLVLGLVCRLEEGFLRNLWSWRGLLWVLGRFLCGGFYEGEWEWCCGVLCLFYIVVVNVSGIGVEYSILNKCPISYRPLNIFLNLIIPYPNLRITPPLNIPYPMIPPTNLTIPNIFSIHLPINQVKHIHIIIFQSKHQYTIIIIFPIYNGWCC